MRSLTVLVIDDDLGDIELLRRHLAEIPDWEIHVVAQHDAESGRAALKERSIDVVFLDYRLGAVNGLDVLREIRQDGGTCPVVFLTGQGDERVAAAFRRAGGDDYLTKRNMTPETLRNSIAYVLDEYAREQERLGFEEMLSRLANTDDLTEFLNRRTFMKVLHKETARTRRYGRPLALMVVDVDDFAHVAEDHGRPVADQVLALVADHLKASLRETDWFGRYEGEVFCVALTETDRELALGAGERVRALIEATPFPVTDGRTVSLTCSVGLVQIEGELLNADTSLARAFSLIYAIRAEGGNRISYASLAEGHTQAL